MKTLSHALASLIPRRTKLVLVARGGVRVGVPTQTAAPHLLIRARAQESPRRIMTARGTVVPAGWGVVPAVKAGQTERVT